MQKYNGQLIRQFASSVSGNAASGVTVTVRRKSDNALTTLYVDNNTAGATLSNPITTSATGHFAFYAADGVYTLTFSDSTPQQVIQLQDVAALQDQFDGAVLNAGYIPSGTFAAGATLTQANQVLSDGSSYWRWDGSFPKTVGAGSSPAPTGVGGWILVSDGGLRGDLASTNSSVSIAGVPARVLVSFDSVAALSSAATLPIGAYVEVNDYYGGANKNNSGKLLFEIVADGTGTVDGGSIIQLTGRRARQIFRDGVPRVKQFGARACNVGGTGFDSFSAFQAAINYSTAVYIDYEPNGYLIGDSLNCTHRANGLDIIGVGAGIFGAYTVIYGNTGIYPIFDCIGSQKVRFKSLQLKGATSNTDPSRMAILLARSNTAGYDYAQFCVLEDVQVNLPDIPAAYGGMGTIGIYNQAAEICTFRDTYSIANNGLVITSVNLGGVFSKYRIINTSISSTSDFKFEGSCTFTSIGSVGAPLYTSGAQSMHGAVYLNGGYGRTVDTRSACGVVLDGISQGHDVTFFVEFSPHWAWYGGTLKDCDIRFQGSIQDTRYVLADTANFSSMRDVDITILNSLSSPVSLPPYHIKNKTADTIKNVNVYAPADPTTDWVKCTDTQFNRINSCYYGNNQRTVDVVDLAADFLWVRNPTTRARSGKIIWCTGNPEGAVTANMGTVAISDNGNVYRKGSGTGNTGWVAM